MVVAFGKDKYSNDEISEGLSTIIDLHPVIIDNNFYLGRHIYHKLAAYDE